MEAINIVKEKQTKELTLRKKFMEDIAQNCTLKSVIHQM